MPPKSSAADGLQGQFERMELGIGGSRAAASASSAAPAVTVSPADEAKIVRTIGGLLELLDTLEADSATPLPSTVPLDSAHMAAYATTLSHAVTKFVLFSSQGEAAALVDQAAELRTHLSGISRVLRALLAPPTDAAAQPLSHAAAPGATLRAQLLTVHTSLLSGFRALFKQLQQHMLAKEHTKLEGALTARVWEVIEKSLKAVPLCNAHAVGKLLLQQCGLLRDAKQELAEMKAADADDADEDGGDDDDDDFDDDYSAADLVMVPAITQLVGMAQQLLHAVYGYVLKTAPAVVAVGAVEDAQAASGVETPERVEWLESALAQARALIVGVDETVSAVGDEQGITLAAVQKLTEQCRQLAASVVRHHRASSGAKWPMGAAAAAGSAASAASSGASDSGVPPSWSSCEACFAVLSEVDSLPSPSQSADEDPAAPVSWLRKVLTALHQAHADAEKAAAEAEAAEAK